MTDRETGRVRGFAFVEMTNASEADKAIAALNGSELGGRRLMINEAKPKSDRPRSSGHGLGAERNVGAMTTAATHGNHANLVGSSVLC